MCDEELPVVMQRLCEDNQRLREYLARIKREATSRHHLTESRGSYRWNDNDYRREFGWALDVFYRLANEALATKRTVDNARIVPLYEFMGE